MWNVFIYLVIDLIGFLLFVLIKMSLLFLLIDLYLFVLLWLKLFGNRIVNLMNLLVWIFVLILEFIFNVKLVVECEFFLVFWLSNCIFWEVIFCSREWLGVIVCEEVCWVLVDCCCEVVVCMGIDDEGLFLLWWYLFI